MPGGQLIATTEIHDLPQELKRLIVSFLTNHDPLKASQDIRRLRLVSPEWNQIVVDYLKWLWNKKVSEGWLNNFLTQESQINFQIQNLQQPQNLTLAVHRKSHNLKTKQQTNLVIRHKISVLKTLIENAGIPLPESLKKFPSLTDSNAESDRELELELALQDIEQMARGKKKQMTPSQKKQIQKAITDCLKSKEHKKGTRGSTKQTHQDGMARRQADKWNRAYRIFMNSGFQAALDDAKRC